MGNKLFVYGSLRKGFFNYEKYLKGNVLSIEDATIKGKLYHMPYKGYPAIEEGTGTIHGELITVKNPESVIKAIDKMEGFKGDGNPTNEYHKIKVDVTLNNKETVKCPIYFYNKKIDKNFNDDAVYIKNGDWKEYMNSLSE